MGSPMNGDMYEGQLRPGDVGLTKEQAEQFKDLTAQQRMPDFQRMFREQGAKAADDSGAAREMPRYKCHKEVWALKIRDAQQAPANLSFCSLTMKYGSALKRFVIIAPTSFTWKKGSP